MTPTYMLGIDLGTSSVKVIVVDLDGQIHGSGAASYPTSYPEPLHAEQEPTQWWTATVTATWAALSDAGTTDITAIGLTGQMHGTVLLDADGAPIVPAIIWSDGRAAAEVAAMTAEIGADRVISLAGSPLAPGFQAATLRWLRDNQPNILALTHKILTPKAFLAWSLTGENVTDPSDASGTLLFDVQNRAWSSALTHASGAMRAMLPAILPSDAICGGLTTHAAMALGLRPGIPVATGGADAPCAALGSGVVDADSLLLTFSTGAQALIPRGNVVVDSGGRLHTFCSTLRPVTGSGWYTMGATLAAGMALTWLQDQALGLTAANALDDMLHSAHDVPAGSRGLIFLPYLAGERTPHLNPLASGVYLGLTNRHGSGEIVRATLEGVAFAAYDAFLALESLGVAPERIIAAGGGARMPLWRHTVADLFRLPVFPLLADEQTALGAAILAGSAMDLLDPMETSRRWAIQGAPATPDRAVGERLHELFAIYQRTYQRLKDDMAELRRIAGKTSR